MSIDTPANAPAQGDALDTEVDLNLLAQPVRSTLEDSG
jgi:hypothetical protein